MKTFFNLKYLNDNITRRSYKNLCPEVLHAGDIYIVEFPKSGVTWLSTIIANACSLEFGNGKALTYFSAKRLIPDLHSSRAIAPRLNSVGLGFYKSHSTFNPNYSNIIYLARHPASVMHSYLRHYNSFNSNSYNFKDFLKDKKMGLLAWKKHIRSWLSNNKDQSQKSIHLIRYEDLILNAQQEIFNLNINFSLGLSKSSILKAIERSSLSNLRKQEKLYIKNNPGYKMSFFEQSKITKEEIFWLDYISSECSFELKLLGYT